MFDDLSRPAKKFTTSRETGKGGVQDKCVTHARGQGWWARKFSSPMRSGGTDYILAKAGRVIFPEFKAPGEGPTELQAEEHAKMRAAGLTVWVIDDVAKFKSMLAFEDALL
jgi:hypothetical protein